VNASYEEKLIEMLTEIQSGIQQIKFDLQSLIKQRPKAVPQDFSVGDEVAEFGEAGGSASVEDVLRYLREKRGDDDLGSD
jgi:hypothetical protein